MAKVAMNRMSKGNTFYGRKALGMGLGTRDRTSNRTFSISVFHHRYQIDKKPFFFAADEKTIFFDEKTLFFDEKTFFLRQVRKRHFFCGRTGSKSVGVRFGVSDRTTGGVASSVELPNHGTEALPRPIPRKLTSPLRRKPKTHRFVCVPGSSLLC